MVPLLRLRHALKGPPRPEQGYALIQSRLGREHQHQGAEVRPEGHIQPAVTGLARQVLIHPRLPLRLGGGADLGLIVKGQGQPPHVLGADPLVEPQPPEIALRRLAHLGGLGLLPELSGLHSHAVAGVAGFPQRLIVDIQIRNFVRIVLR